MREEFNFTASVKSSAKEAWNDRPRDWSNSCTVENKTNDDGREYVEIQSRSVGSFGGSSTGHESFDTFINEIFGLCRSHNLNNQGNQNYLVYDDGEYEVICHTNYEFWVPRFGSMTMVKKNKDKDSNYIFQQSTSIIDSIKIESDRLSKSLSDCLTNSLSKIEKLRDVATTDLEKRHICEMIEYLQDATESLNVFAEAFSELTESQSKTIKEDVDEASIDTAANQS